MKKILSILTCISLILSSCQSSDKSEAHFKLLPSPKEFTITGVGELSVRDIKHYFSEDGSTLPVLGSLLSDLASVEEMVDAQISYSINGDMEIGDEGYSIVIDTDLIRIIGNDKAGLFYAFMTLEQLMEDAKELNSSLPLCTIMDYPSLAYRGIHLDLKHHMEQLPYYYKMMDRLASYKVNAIIVEFEDKLGYKKQADVASPDAMPIGEWIKLSDYAKERNIEISPLIQGLGHASFVLKHEQYKELRDIPDSDWAFNPLNQKTYEVQFDLYTDAIEATPHGKYLHVGGDEVHTTGRGSEKSALELQLIWLNKVCQFAEEQGRTPIFWDDMPLKHAGVIGPTYNIDLSKAEVDKVWETGEQKLLDFLDQFPENCIYMRWNYGSPQALGNLRAMQWYTDNGLQVMGATAGQTRWDLMPQNQSNLENIKAFAVSSIQTNLTGLLLTLWDDSSPHFELFWRGIIFFSEYTWAGDVRSNDELKAAYRVREFGSKLGHPEYAFIDRLEGPVGFWGRAVMQKSSRNNLHRFKNPKEEAILSLPDPENKGAWIDEHKDRLKMAERMILECDTVTDIINEAKAEAIKNPYTLEMYEQVNNIVRFTPRALMALKAFDESSDSGTEKEALEEIHKLSEEFELKRKKLEEVYAKARILHKPDNYILDQDHHTHAANQSLNFDWQFYAEILFLEKINKSFK
jgi:hexosaminidase